MNTKKGLSASLRSTFRRSGVLASLPTSPNEKARARLWAVALLLTLVRTWGIFLIDELLLTSRLRTPVVSFYLLLAAALFFLGKRQDEVTLLECFPHMRRRSYDR